MTDKEKVLERWPDARSTWSHYEMQYVIWVKSELHDEIKGMGDTRKEAWHNAAQTIAAAEKLN